MFGVENREEDAVGVAKRENPLPDPDEADEAGGAAPNAVDAPGIAELAKSPET